MSTLPDPSELTGAGVTESQFKTKLTQFIEFVNSLADEINQSSSSLSLEILARQALIDTARSTEGIVLTDLLQRVWLEVTKNGLQWSDFGIESIGDQGLRIVDALQRVWFEVNQDGLHLPSFSLQKRSDDRVVIVDERQRVVADFSPPQDVYVDLSRLLFGTVLCGFGDTETQINIAALLKDRAWQRSYRHVQAGIGATGTTVLSPYYRHGRDYLRFSTASLGATAEMVVADSRYPDLVARFALTVATVPAGAGQTLTYLGIGDSIENRQGGLIVKQQLEARGFVVNCVGTLNGVGNQNDVPTGGGGGVLGEGREGWRIADWTHQTAAKSPVAAGDEASYNANGKSTKMGRHPYIRVATGGDPVGDVRNGYILDFAWGWGRFSVPTPTDICVTLGANDMLAYTGQTLTDIITSELSLLLRRLRIGAPSARIVVAVPNTGLSTQFDDLWFDRDVRAYTAIKSVVNALADTKIVWCPAYAYQPYLLGQPMTTTAPLPVTDTVFGAAVGVQADQIHPQNANRAALHTAKAAYIGCLAKSLI